MGWKTIEIPLKLVGEEVSRTVGMREYSRTQIFLPDKSEYEGYMFWHPTKLISRLSETRSAVFRFDEYTFTFKLEKRHREPGRRYRRFSLSAAEIEAIYLPEQEKILRRRRKKQESSDAQTGEILLYRRVMYDRAAVWFDFRPYRGGKTVKMAGDVKEPVVLAENVTRSCFKRCCEHLEAGKKNLEMIAGVEVQLLTGTYRGVESQGKDLLLKVAQTAWEESVREVREQIALQTGEEEKK